MSRRRRPASPPKAAPNVPRGPVEWLPVATIGVSAFLLFQVQPLIARRMLPAFGGSAVVWVTALLFFQVVLLFGYAKTHWLLARLGTRGHRRVLLGLLAGSLVCLPLGVPLELGAEWPAPLRLFLLLGVSVGPPYLVLASTSPVVQHWIAARPEGAKSPYGLYAVSNAGSLLGLLSYPLLLEPTLGLAAQARLWSAGYVLYAILLALTAARLPAGSGHAAPLGRTPKLGLLLRSAIPCALLVAVTRHLTEEVSSFPLLWVLPLALYLASFVLCFAAPRLAARRPVANAMTLAAAGALLLRHVRLFEPGLILDVLVASAALFLVCVALHGELERRKPPPAELTGYYLYLSLGGCAGGTLASLGAPLVLSGLTELPLSLLAAAWLVFAPAVSRPRLRRVLGATLGAAAGLTCLVEETRIRLPFPTWRPPLEIHRARSFYSTYRIEDEPAWEDEELTVVAARMLRNGSTIHGGQARDAAGQLMPITYYHERTLVGFAMQRLEPRRVAAVGLGAGVLAVYGRPGQSIDFFEIDSLDVALASRWFDNLQSSRATIRHLVGDARLLLRRQPARSYDLIVLDAFSGGAVPLHLLTLEALREYLGVLAPGGVLLFHISSHHVDLGPVLLAAAEVLDLAYAFDISPDDLGNRKADAYWVALTPSAATRQRLLAGRPFRRPTSERRVLFTDDFASLWPVLALSWRSLPSP